MQASTSISRSVGVRSTFYSSISFSSSLMSTSVSFLLETHLISGRALPPTHVCVPDMSILSTNMMPQYVHMPKGAPIVVWGEKYFLFLNILFFFSHVHLRLISLRDSPHFWTDPSAHSCLCPGHVHIVDKSVGSARKLVRCVRANEAF